MMHERDLFVPGQRVLCQLVCSRFRTACWLSQLSEPKKLFGGLHPYVFIKGPLPVDAVARACLVYHFLGTVLKLPGVQQMEFFEAIPDYPDDGVREALGYRNELQKLGLLHKPAGFIASEPLLRRSIDRTHVGFLPTMTRTSKAWPVTVVLDASVALDNISPASLVLSTVREDVCIAAFLAVIGRAASLTADHAERNFVLNSNDPRKPGFGVVDIDNKFKTPKGQRPAYRFHRSRKFRKALVSLYDSPVTGSVIKAELQRWKTESSGRRAEFMSKVGFALHHLGHAAVEAYWNDTQKFLKEEMDGYIEDLRSKEVYKKTKKANGRNKNAKQASSGGGEADTEDEQEELEADEEEEGQYVEVAESSADPMELDEPPALQQATTTTTVTTKKRAASSVDSLSPSAKRTKHASVGTPTLDGVHSAVVVSAAAAAAAVASDPEPSTTNGPSLVHSAPQLLATIEFTSGRLADHSKLAGKGAAISRNGLTVDLLYSLVQKAIRRGEFFVATAAMLEVHHLVAKARAVLESSTTPLQRSEASIQCKNMLGLWTGFLNRILVSAVEDTMPLCDTQALERFRTCIVKLLSMTTNRGAKFRIPSPPEDVAYLLREICSGYAGKDWKEGRLAPTSRLPSWLWCVLSGATSSQELAAADVPAHAWDSVCRFTSNATDKQELLTRAAIIRELLQLRKQAAGGWTLFQDDPPVDSALQNPRTSLHAQFVCFRMALDAEKEAKSRMKKDKEAGASDPDRFAVSSLLDSFLLSGLKALAFDGPRSHAVQALAKATREGPPSERRAFIQAMLVVLHCFGKPEFQTTTTTGTRHPPQRPWEATELDDGLFRRLLTTKQWKLDVRPESIAYDMHTRVGKKLARGEAHFATESAATNDPIGEPVANAFRAIYTAVKCSPARNA